MSSTAPGKFLFKQIINKEFTLFIVARILFIAGLRMTPVLLGWRLYELTDSKLALGMLGLSEVIPAIALALPAGVRVDKSNKQRLLAICMTLYLLLMMALATITSDWMQSQYSTRIIEWSIYAIMAATGAVRAYSGAAFNAFLAQLVPADALVKAASINSMIWLLAAVRTRTSRAAYGVYQYHDRIYSGARTQSHCHHPFYADSSQTHQLAGRFAHLGRCLGGGSACMASKSLVRGHESRYVCRLIWWSSCLTACFRQ